MTGPVCGARLFGVALLCLGGAAGCRREEASASAAFSTITTPRNVGGDVKLAYSHTLSIDIAADHLAERFTAARDRCLGDAALRCVVVESQIEQDPIGAAPPHARLDVHLPHDTVAAYVGAVTAPMVGQPAASVVVRAQGSRAEDLARPIEDGARRLAQLADYRARLTELAGRPDTRTDDLIKIAAEVSRTQSDIEAADARQRGLAARVETEALSIALQADLAAGGMWSPVRETWRRAGVLLGQSAGDALRFAIVALPWMPIAVAILALLRWVWRRRSGRSGTPPLSEGPGHISG